MAGTSITSEISGSNSISYRVSFRKVKYPRLEFTTRELLLILPPGHDPETLLKMYEKWIRRNIEFIEGCLEESSKMEIFERSEEEFRYLVRRIAHGFSRELRVDFNRIFFRRMKTQWGSCSPRKNLTVNRLMMNLPEHLIEYVIYHEVAHLVVRKHNDKFWKIIRKKFPDYRVFERDLTVYWYRLA